MITKRGYLKMVTIYEPNSGSKILVNKGLLEEAFECEFSDEIRSATNSLGTHR